MSDPLPPTGIPKMEKKVLRVITPEQWELIKAGGLDELNDLTYRSQIARDRVTKMLSTLEPQFNKDPAVQVDVNTLEFWKLVPVETPAAPPADAPAAPTEPANPVVGEIKPAAPVEATDPNPPA